MLGDVPAELGNLDLVLEFPLEGGEEDFPLARLEAITQMWNGSGAICNRELNELLIDEVQVPEMLHRVIDDDVGLVAL